MFETAKLRGRMIEKYGTLSNFASAAHSSVSYVSQYLNGKKILDQRTIDRWADTLDIPVEEYSAYFFKRKVHETQQS